MWAASKRRRPSFRRRSQEEANNERVREIFSLFLFHYLAFFAGDIEYGFKAHALNDRYLLDEDT